MKQLSNMGTTGKACRQWSGEGRKVAQVGGGVVLLYELILGQQVPEATVFQAFDCTEYTLRSSTIQVTSLYTTVSASS